MEYQCVRCGLKDSRLKAIQLHQLRESHYSGIDVLGGVIDRMPIEGGTNFPPGRLAGTGNTSTLEKCRGCGGDLNMEGECRECNP